MNISSRSTKFRNAHQIWINPVFKLKSISDLKASGIRMENAHAIRKALAYSIEILYIIEDRAWKWGSKSEYKANETCLSRYMALITWSCATTIALNW